MTPIVIAHRGASGYRPEHTLAAYWLAIEQGADFIEPDLVATRDGVLIARHENELSGTTDVAARPEFADRRCSKRVDGTRRTGWFSEDFTLAEIKTLRARERVPDLRPQNTAWDGQFEVPTLAEILALLAEAEAGGRRVGLYPETKHPTWFAHEGVHQDGYPIGISLGAALVRDLVAAGFTDPARVFIQSFEVANLVELKTELMPAAGVDFPLVQLMGNFLQAAPHDFRWHASRGDDPRRVYGGFAEALPRARIASLRYRDLAVAPVLSAMRRHYAAGVGPAKDSLLPRGLRRRIHPSLAAALDAGLLVHPYTLRAELGAADDLPRLLALGVQGFFIDQPDLGVELRRVFLSGRSA
jgi:glycerophosphoryl diester phosphodiesterase